MARLKTMYLCFITILILSSCGRSTQIDEETAKNLIIEEFNYIMAVDESSNPIAKAIQEGFTVEIKSIKKQDGGFVVNGEFSNFDLLTAVNQLDEEEQMTMEEFYKVIIDALEQTPRQTREISIQITADQDENYSVQFTDEQFDYATGGLLTYYDEVLG